MNIIELTNLYSKIKNNKASEEEKNIFDLEIKRNCIDERILMMIIEDNTGD